MRALGIVLFAAGLLTAGCSLFGNYNLEGLPCDPSARAGEECLPDAGFVCARVDGGAGQCIRTK